MFTCKNFKEKYLYGKGSDDEGLKDGLISKMIEFEPNEIEKIKKFIANQFKTLYNLTRFRIFREIGFDYNHAASFKIVVWGVNDSPERFSYFIKFFKAFIQRQKSYNYKFLLQDLNLFITVQKKNENLSNNVFERYCPLDILEQMKNEYRQTGLKTYTLEFLGFDKIMDQEESLRSIMSSSNVLIKDSPEKTEMILKLYNEQFTLKENKIEEYGDQNEQKSQTNNEKPALKVDNKQAFQITENQQSIDIINKVLDQHIKEQEEKNENIADGDDEKNGDNERSFLMLENMANTMIDDLKETTFLGKENDLEVLPMVQKKTNSIKTDSELENLENELILPNAEKLEIKNVINKTIKIQKQEQKNVKADKTKINKKEIIEKLPKAKQISLSQQAKPAEITDCFQVNTKRVLKDQKRLIKEIRLPYNNDNVLLNIFLNQQLILVEMIKPVGINAHYYNIFAKTKKIPKEYNIDFVDLDQQNKNQISGLLKKDDFQSKMVVLPDFNVPEIEMKHMPIIDQLLDLYTHRMLPMTLNRMLSIGLRRSNQTEVQINEKEVLFQAQEDITKVVVDLYIVKKPDGFVIFYHHPNSPHMSKKKNYNGYERRIYSQMRNFQGDLKERLNVSTLDVEWDTRALEFGAYEFIKKHANIKGEFFLNKLGVKKSTKNEYKRIFKEAMTFGFYQEFFEYCKCRGKKPDNQTKTMANKIRFKKYKKLVKSMNILNVNLKKLLVTFYQSDNSMGLFNHVSTEILKKDFKNVEKPFLNKLRDIEARRTVIIILPRNVSKIMEMNCGDDLMVYEFGDHCKEEQNEWIQKKESSKKNSFEYLVVKRGGLCIIKKLNVTCNKNDSKMHLSCESCLLNYDPVEMIVNNYNKFIVDINNFKIFNHIHYKKIKEKISKEIPEAKLETLDASVEIKLNVELMNRVNYFVYDDSLVDDNEPSLQIQNKSNIKSISNNFEKIVEKGVNKEKNQTNLFHMNYKNTQKVKSIKLINMGAIKNGNLKTSKMPKNKNEKTEEKSLKEAKKNEKEINKEGHIIYPSKKCTIKIKSKNNLETKIKSVEIIKSIEDLKKEKNINISDKKTSNFLHILEQNSQKLVKTSEDIIYEENINNQQKMETFSSSFPIKIQSVSKKKDTLVQTTSVYDEKIKEKSNKNNSNKNKKIDASEKLKNDLEKDLNKLLQKNVKNEKIYNYIDILDKKYVNLSENDQKIKYKATETIKKNLADAEADNSKPIDKLKLWHKEFEKERSQIKKYEKKDLELNDLEKFRKAKKQIKMDLEKLCSKYMNQTNEILADMSRELKISNGNCFFI